MKHGSVTGSKYLLASHQKEYDPIFEGRSVTTPENHLLDWKNRLVIKMFFLRCLKTQ